MTALMKSIATGVLRMLTVLAVSDVHRVNVFPVNAQPFANRSVVWMAIPMETPAKPHANTSTVPLKVTVLWTWSVRVQMYGVPCSSVSASCHHCQTDARSQPVMGVLVAKGLPPVLTMVDACPPVMMLLNVPMVVMRLIVVLSNATNNNLRVLTVPVSLFSVVVMALPIALTEAMKWIAHNQNVMMVGSDALTVNALTRPMCVTVSETAQMGKMNEIVRATPAPKIQTVMPDSDVRTNSAKSVNVRRFSNLYVALTAIRTEVRVRRDARESRSHRLANVHLP